AIATTVDTYSRTVAKGIQSVEVLGLDASVGGDGIVAKKTIKNVGALKGQKVAVSAGSTSQWLLAYALSKQHLSLKDVNQIDLKTYRGKSPADSKTTMQDVPLWSLKQSCKYYGTPAKPGPINKIYAMAANHWKSTDKINSLPRAEAAIDPSCVCAFCKTARGAV